MIYAFYTSSQKNLIYLDLDGEAIISINLEDYYTCTHSHYTEEQMNTFNHKKITAKEAVELLRLDIP